MQNIASTILQQVEGIEPWDELERAHQRDVTAWINSGAPLFRVTKPDQPPQHLVSYFVLADLSHRALLLVDHINAERWLPTGGHVEPGEDPRSTVEREVIEELNKPAHFVDESNRAPLFITVTQTVGLTAGHTDVSLWYLLHGRIDEALAYDPSEFRGVRWFSYDDILAFDISLLDPHMHRFVRKLIAMTPQDV